MKALIFTLAALFSISAFAQVDLPKDILTFSDKFIDAPDIYVGGTSIGEVTITNNTDYPLAMDTTYVRKYPANFQKFGCGYLEAGQSCVMQIAFQPSQIRNYSAFLIIEGLVYVGPTLDDAIPYSESIRISAKAY